MRCDEVLVRLSDLDGHAEREADVAAHLAACAECRSAAAGAREAAGLVALLAATDGADGSDDDLRPADAAAAWSAVQRASAVSPAASATGAGRLLRIAVRTAAAVLAAVGAASLLGARVEASEGRVAVAFEPAWLGAASPAPSPVPPALAPRLDALARQIDGLAAAVAAGAQAGAETAAWLDARRAEEMKALAEAVSQELGLVRRDVSALQWRQAVADARIPPPLPDAQ